MNDLQARLAHTGEADRGSVGAAVRPGEPGSAGDPMQLHEAIAAAPPSQQAIVLERLRLIDRVAQAIRSQTPDPLERARMAQHIAQTHPEMGIDAGMLTPQAMSDANIAALHELASEATLRVALAKLNETGAPGVGGGNGAVGGPAAVGGPNRNPLPVQTAAPPLSGPSHAARGFTIVGVE